jgi:hypothetical protein
MPSPIWDTSRAVSCRDSDFSEPKWIRPQSFSGLVYSRLIAREMALDGSDPSGSPAASGQVRFLTSVGTHG